MRCSTHHPEGHAPIGHRERDHLLCGDRSAVHSRGFTYGSTARADNCRRSFSDMSHCWKNM